jgi:hypothetical protein
MAECGLELRAAMFAPADLQEEKLDRAGLREQLNT